MSTAEYIEDCQDARGAFVSLVRQNNGQRTDANGFITALVLRELLKRPGLASLKVMDKAFDFLASCASPTIKGSFNFYPSDNFAKNAWKVPDDADDTALITQLFLQTGRLQRKSLIRNTYVLLDRYRITDTNHFDPPWVIPGAYYTWLDEGGGLNVADCCVNANVAALYAYAGLTHLRGYGEACSIVCKGIEWAGHCPRKLAALTPFYAAPAELYYAVANAVQMGAVLLTDALYHLDMIKPDGGAPDLQNGICCSAYGRITWHCPLLQQLRNLS